MPEHIPKRKVVLLTQYEMPRWKRNMNAYERIYRGSESAEITLIVRRNAEVSDEINDRVHVKRSFLQHRYLFLFHCFLIVIRLRLQGYRYVLTEPSGFAAVGFVAKYLAGYFWVMDIWDRPRWHAGNHEEGSPVPFTDRIVFWIMKRADFYILSCLPRAAKDVAPPPKKCAQFLNAIELDEVSEAPPTWNPDVEVLRATFARSKFPVTSGLQLIVEAAEILQKKQLRAMFHLVGKMTDEGQALIDQSPACDMIVVEGFIDEKRTDFFARMHVGIVPYLPYEDVSHIFPIKVLEHLSQGNPVIASDLPGLTAVVKDEYNGLLFDPGNGQDLALQLERFLTDPELWKELASNAHQSILQYGAQEKVLEIFKAIYAADDSRSSRRN